MRLETYTDVPLTPAMTEKMVEITVEVLGILATATKEMQQNQASKFALRHTFLGAHIDSRKNCEEDSGVEGLRGWSEEARHADK